MEDFKRIKHTKDVFNELESFLVSNQLLDQRNIWFAGFDDTTRGGQNAVARNLLYGNKNLRVICVKQDELFLLRNNKDEFVVEKLGNVQEKIVVKVHRNILYPSIELHFQNDNSVYLQATKNKQMVKELKKLLK
jgi:hypothetical protein